MGFAHVEPPRRAVSETTIARAESPRGEVVLRRRTHDGELELRVNGIFVMDTRETSTERAIARLALDSVSDIRVGLRVLVGGLGLGFTLAELVASPRVGRILVAEIEPAVVEWHRRGLISATAWCLGAPGLRVEVGDLRDVVAAQSAGTLDSIVLDVDNGPAALVYDDNAAVYQPEFLARCQRTLAGGGVLVVWSADPAPALFDALRAVFGSVIHHTMPVELGRRAESYHAYVAMTNPHQERACPDR